MTPTSLWNPSLGAAGHQKRVPAAGRDLVTAIPPRILRKGLSVFPGEVPAHLIASSIMTLVHDYGMEYYDFTTVLKLPN